MNWERPLKWLRLQDLPLEMGARLGKDPQGPSQNAMGVLVHWEMMSPDLLIALRDTLKAHEHNRGDVLRILETILGWLNENNSEENCKKVDTFVSTEIDVKWLKGLGEEIAGIIWKCLSVG